MKAVPVLVLGLAVALGALTQPRSPAADAADRIYELRTYYAEPGKLDALNARFRDHTCKLFEKHQITSVGYWLPLDNPENKLIYILAFPGKAEHDKSWQEFMADARWRKAYKESEVNGRL